MTGSSLILLAEHTSDAAHDPTTYLVLTTCLVLLVGAALLLIRALRGPTVFDRILAVNAMGTKTVVLVACIAFLDLSAEPGFFLLAGHLHPLDQDQRKQEQAAQRGDHESLRFQFHRLTPVIPRWRIRSLNVGRSLPRPSCR